MFKKKKKQESATGQPVNMMEEEDTDEEPGIPEAEGKGEPDFDDIKAGKAEPEKKPAPFFHPKPHKRKVKAHKRKY